MNPIETYKHLCAAAAVLLVVALLFLVWKWPQGKHMTFSQHAAAHRSAMLYYFLIFTAVLPLLLLFFLGWFVRAFQLPGAFTISIVLAVCFQYSVTIIPEVGGWKTRYHVTGASISALAMLTALLILLVAPTVNGIGKSVTLLSVAAMVVLLYIGAINKIKHTHLLFLQASYYIAFFAAILTVTYAG
ncbi:MAG TPA: hypothetical protein VLF60_02025 [Candidatus Saccharimonadales bacterium]|nr:hypothetical protein [Candidatus Saccharimonadales bacterium]